MNVKWLILWAVTLGLLVIGEVVIAIAGKGDALSLYNAAIVTPIMALLASLAAVLTAAKKGSGSDK